MYAALITADARTLYATYLAFGESRGVRAVGADCLIKGAIVRGEVDAYRIEAHPLRELGFALVLGREAAGAAILRKLSDRESEIFNLSCDGRTTKEIAGLIGIERGTVDNYKTRIRRKLRAKSIAEWIRLRGRD